MELAWSILCGSAAIDKDSGNVSLHNIVGQISFFAPDDIDDNEVKGISVNFTLFSQLWRTNIEEEETGYISADIELPTGELQDVSIPDMKVDLTGEHKRFNARFNFQGFPFVGSGIYRFVVKVRSQPDEEWSEVARVPIEIIRSPLPKNELA
ncbi:MAG: hypothetical protein L0154_03360 [Chloroflexi bacterium]|nr:hypothetical protein [Chloroflexota bacterium]